jgi:hypothetical protein
MPSEYGAGSHASRREPERRGGGGRHRAPQQTSNAVRILRTTGAVTAIVGTGLAASAMPANAATSDDFAKLRQCESGGNYQINTGNGFYGAYQFDAGTWHGLGYAGLPNEASAAQQDEAAAKLYNSRGWAPWPSCSAKLGLSASGPATIAPGASGDAIQRAVTPTPPPLTLDTARAQVADANFTGAPLSIAAANQVTAPALVWQDQMRKKRFVLAVDGRFGQESQGLATLYSFLARTSDGQPGVVGPNLWKVTVTDPAVS